MELVQLQALVAVVDTGSLAAAADALHLTQSAVSKRLQALEQRLGHTLTDRVGRRLTLTEAGRALLPRARSLLAQAQDAQAALDALESDDQAVTGRLAIATSHHIGLYRLPPVLRRYVAAHPGVDLHIDFVDSEDGCRAVQQGELELAIVTLPSAETAWPQLGLHPVWNDELVCVCGPDHVLTQASALRLTDLAAHAAVLPDARTFTHRHVSDAFARAGISLQVRMQTNYLETIKMLVGIGLGWSALPQTMVDDSLVRLPVHLDASRALGVVRHQNRTLSRAAQALLAELLPPSFTADFVAKP